MKTRLAQFLMWVAFFVVAVLFIMLFHDKKLQKDADLHAPGIISSYWNIGYLKIDPETILTEIDNDDVSFKLLAEDPQEIQEITDISIRWTQADFLKIATAASKFLWNDDLGAHPWKIRSIYFEGSCDNPVGFSFASITYFWIGKSTYTTRLIEIEPQFGWLRWGNGKTYPRPFLFKWDQINLSGERIAAEKAVELVSDDAKKRLQIQNICGVVVSTPQNADASNWYLKVFAGSADYLSYTVNIDTGKLLLQKLNQ